MYVPGTGLGVLYVISVLTIDEVIDNLEDLGKKLRKWSRQDWIPPRPI